MFLIPSDEFGTSETTNFEIIKSVQKYIFNRNFLMDNPHFMHFTDTIDYFIYSNFSKFFWKEFS